jgi:hypothetical protein
MNFPDVSLLPVNYAGMKDACFGWRMKGLSAKIVVIGPTLLKARPAWAARSKA